MAPPKDLVIIQPGGDTIISVSKKVGIITRRVAFQVSRALVVKLQLSGDVYDGNNYKISLTGSDAASIETIGVLLQCMSEYGRKNIPAERYIFSIDQVWRVLTLVSVKAGQHFLRGRYNVPSSVLRNWFSAWFDRHAKITTQYVYQTLLYPAFAFRDSESFAAVTKWLAYNATDKIQDRNPPINLPHLYETMRLPKEVLDAVNGARDVLRNRISGLLNQYMKQFLYASSPSGIQRWASIIKTLSYPLECMLKEKSVNETVIAMSIMLGGISPEGAENCCICRMLIEVREEVFEGLCLHCKDIQVNESEQPNHSSFDICKWHEEMAQRQTDLSPSQS